MPESDGTETAQRHVPYVLLALLDQKQARPSEIES
jgi:hypothetical protein